MSISSIIKIECPKHNKVVVEESRITIGSTVMIKAACGCLFPQKNFQDSSYEIVFANGKKPREYQIDALKFGEAAGFNFIIADEQGLGKTIEFLMLVLKHHKEILPAICVVPTTVKLQWLHEVIAVLGKSRFRAQVINSTKETALPGMDIYFATFDMIKEENLFRLVREDIKTIMIDECQRIKNHLSDRAKAVQKLRKYAKYCIPMSGTPIKNHAGEYFTILNLVAPARFPSYQGYLQKYCDTYDSGWGTKVGGLKDPERFHDDTKDLIIRRTKDEVLKDLPSLDRKFFHVELDKKLNKAYGKALDDLEDVLYGEENEFEKGTAIIAIMSRLRHITGQSKVDQCIEFVTEFLFSCDRKITVFTHHKDVADILIYKLQEWCSEGGFAKPLNMHSGLSADGRQNLIQEFKNGPSRILIASTLAAGEGLNIQFCSDAVMLERQWNPANEEQAEARFHRFGQQNNVSITYMIASGTIDEYFTELVETKRAIVASTLDNKEISWNEQSLMKELAQILVTSGKKKWSI